MMLAVLALAAVSQVDPVLPKEVMTSITAERCRADVEKLASFGTRHSLSDTESPTRGIGAARQWIKSEFEAISVAHGGRLRVAFEEFDVPRGARISRAARLANVVAELPGADPGHAERRYYVVGHYDSRNSDGNDFTGDAPGANDDASGTAVVIECARALAGHELPCTIVFLCTVAEEQGLIGARYHADAARARGEKILGVLSNDIVGDPLGPFHPGTGGARRGDVPAPPFVGDPSELANVVRVFSEGIPRNPGAEQLAQIRALAAESDSASRQLARYVAEIASIEGTVVRPRIVFRLDRFLRGGDHSTFNDAGFPAVRFTVPVEEYSRQHQDVRVEGEGAGAQRFGDTPDFCDFEYIANVARLNAAALVHLAASPPPPSSVRIVTAELTNTTTVRWEKVPGAVGYRVVWRDTASSSWEHASAVIRDDSEFTVNMSKDNAHFGVRAVGPTGYSSPVAFAGASAR